MAEFDGDKSQEATPHRRQQARDEGQIAQSTDLASAALLLMALLALWMLGTSIVDYFGRLSRDQLGGQAWLSADAAFAYRQWLALMADLARFVLPLMGLLMLAGVAVHLGQVGFVFLPEKTMPDITRLNPIQGFSRIFSLSNVVHTVFGIFKIILIAAVAYTVIRRERDTLLGLVALSAPQIAQYLVQLLFWTAMKIALALLSLAVLDYLFQRWKFEQDIRMTQQEVREELKNLEGNPQVISRRKQVQRQLAMNRLATDVPKADVIITNPTELAVAIQYDPEKMAAPVVVAKGAGVVAQRIRQLALERGIPIVERKPLAQALYREVDVNHPIPQEKYAAVAEVLAYVYQLKGKDIPTPRQD